MNTLEYFTLIFLFLKVYLQLMHRESLDEDYLIVHLSRVIGV